MSTCHDPDCPKCVGDLIRQIEYENMPFIDRHPMITLAILAAIASVIFCMIIWPKEAQAYDEVVLQTIAMEAAGEPFEGQVAVASVILNRSKLSGRTLESVCLAPRQFSAWNSPKAARTWLDRHYTPKTREIALSALNKAMLGPMTNLTHYHALSVKPYWAKGHEPALVIGQHAFYGGID